MRGLWRSFAGGEITPELLGRIDIVKYQTGLAMCKNAVILPHGPASRRPGFAYVNTARDSAHRVRIIPFAFSATQTVVLEMGHQYIRFHINGATLLEANVTVSAIAGNQVTATGHGYSAGDVVYMGRYLKVAAVVDVNNFTVSDLWGASVTPAGTTVARVYTIATPYVEADLFDIHFAQKNDILTFTHPGYAARELARLGTTNWTLSTVSFVAPAGSGVAPGVAQTAPTAGAAEPQAYVYTGILADGVTETLPSPSTTVSTALGLSGNYNTISWSAMGGGIVRYNIYKQRGGTFGFIGQTTGLSIVDNNILPDTAKTPPISNYTLNDSSGNYPSAVTYYEQRRWFAGTTTNPQSVWGTRTATENNLTSSLPSQEDDALLFRIASQQQNAIRHILPLADILVLTVGGEFRVYSDNAPAIGPTTLTVKPQGYSGAANVQPVLSNNSILYVQAQGSRVRELAYNWQPQAYTSNDVSIMAPHLFNGYTIADMAFVRAPIPILWCVRSDGALLGLTYVPEQQVYGWHQHSAGGDGVFESVCVVSEGFEDVLYAVVRRTINGQSVRYIERLHTRVFTAQADAFCVDSGLTYSGTPITSLSGLYHMEGQTVQVCADGAVFSSQTVTNGTIALDSSASTVHVGLQYVTQIQTLPVVVMGDASYGEGLTKNVNKVALRVTQSNLVRAGPSFAKLTDYPARNVSDPYGSPPALRTAELRFAISPSWGSDGPVCIQQDQPVPLTVLSIALDYAGGG